MNSESILFVSHKDRNCGVYQFGRNVAHALSRARMHSFRYLESSDADELDSAMAEHHPAAIIYNYHPATMAWLTARTTKRIPVPQIGVLHEVTQRIANRADTRMFDYHVAPDPTLLLRNPRVFKTGRYIPEFDNDAEPPDIPTIGSFGFGTPGKGFERLIDQVQDEFGSAHIRLHIPNARFGDADGRRARAIANACRARVTKPGIQLTITHNFISNDELLDFLAGNSINAFLYDDAEGRGISSVIDFALAVSRPIAVSTSSMFRHLHDAQPSVTVGRTSLRTILENGWRPLERYRRDWTIDNLTWDYERIVSAVLERGVDPSSRKANRPSALGQVTSAVRDACIERAFAVGSRTLQWAAAHGTPDLAARVRRLGRRTIERLGGSASSDRLASIDWVPTGSVLERTMFRTGVPPYSPDESLEPTYNRILDDDARAHYRNAIEYLHQVAPDVIGNKIPAANVQQAFVLDTVTRLAADIPDARLLCVGSYEDTACIALIVAGHDIQEVDPVLNYDLTTFLTRPSVHPGAFDIVFSTSVIEHITDDEQFVTQIASLLSLGGYAVLTCDFNDEFKPGDPLPREDRRFYTISDLTERLLRKMDGCEIVDEPRWTGALPDFQYDGCNYSFATLVVRKVATLQCTSALCRQALTRTQDSREDSQQELGA